MSQVSFVNFKQPDDKIDTQDPIGTLMFANEEATKIYLIDLIGFDSVSFGIQDSITFKDNIPKLAAFD